MNPNPELPIVPHPTEVALPVNGVSSQPATVPPILQRTPGELWARRIFLIALVCLCTVLGVILVILPWYPQWVENTLLVGYPRLQAVFANGFFRGICSGLGLLDIWIAISETLHYQE